MADPIRVLFLCTGNSARSILAEAIANDRFANAISAQSAGSAPSSHPHPGAIETLERHGIATAGLESKSIDAIAPGSFELAITLCDESAGEMCTVGDEARHLHWGFPDPPAAKDPAAMFEAVFSGLVAAMEQFVTAAEA